MSGTIVDEFQVRGPEDEVRDVIAERPAVQGRNLDGTTPIAKVRYYFADDHQPLHLQTDGTFKDLTAQSVFQRI